MQKIVGSLIVIAACTMMGFEKSREMQQHLKELEELKKIFVMFRREISLSKKIFSELFRTVGRQTEGVYREWLNDIARELDTCTEGTFQKIWKTSIEKHFGEFKLSMKERENLQQVGVGLYYAETIDLYLAQLDFAIKDTREELGSKKKVYQTLGIMCGIFLVIVLV